MLLKLSSGTHNQSKATTFDFLWNRLSIFEFMLLAVHLILVGLVFLIMSIFLILWSITKTTRFQQILFYWKNWNNIPRKTRLCHLGHISVFWGTPLLTVLKGPRPTVSHTTPLNLLRPAKSPGGYSVNLIPWIFFTRSEIFLQLTRQGPIFGPHRVQQAIQHCITLSWFYAYFSKFFC